MHKPYKKPRFITPPNKLKAKIGSGGIAEALLDKSQDFIENTAIDFIPYAKNFLNEFAKTSKAAVNNTEDPEAKDKIIEPIMQLKANGGMFKYQLVSDVADIALQFLETIPEINNDAYAVLIAHEKTIEVIINSKLTGDGGREGYALVKELDQACKRYFSKHPDE